MLDHDRLGLAAGYVLASVAAGYLAIGVGHAVLRRAHRLVDRRAGRAAEGAL